MNDTIDNNLSKCIDGASDFFHTYRDAFLCLLGSNKDIAFVKHDINNDGGMCENYGIKYHIKLVINDKIQAYSHCQPGDSNDV